MGPGGCPLSFRITFLVFFPGGLKRGKCLAPRSPVSLPGLVRRSFRGRPGDGAGTVDRLPVGTVGGLAVGRARQGRRGLVGRPKEVWRPGTVARAASTGVVGWVGVVDGHSPPPNADAQCRIHPSVGNGSGWCLVRITPVRPALGGPRLQRLGKKQRPAHDRPKASGSMTPLLGRLYSRPNSARARAEPPEWTSAR